MPTIVVAICVGDVVCGVTVLIVDDCANEGIVDVDNDVIVIVCHTVQ